MDNDLLTLWIPLGIIVAVALGLGGKKYAKERDVTRKYLGATAAALVLFAIVVFVLILAPEL